MLNRLFQRTRQPKAAEARKFGSLDGVFLPTLLTILGAVMYLRTGWVVGNAGLLGAWLIIVLANTITFCTGLSISSVATNIRVGAGGSFSIISQSLGLEVGGSVNLPFYFAQAISVAFYIFAFTEGWISIFPQHPAVLILLLAFAVLFRHRLCERWAGGPHSLPHPHHRHVLHLFGIAGGYRILSRGAALHAPVLGRIPGWQLLADLRGLFPAVTGVLAGVNLSGTLVNPRQEHPTRHDGRDCGELSRSTCCWPIGCHAWLPLKRC